MKVLLFSNDLMPFGNLPTSGGGLRCWQIMQGLLSQGIEVVASMPGFTYLAEKHADEIPAEQRELLWRWETQDAILRREKPDAVIFASNWDHYNLSKKPDVPLIIDLHGSRLIETTMWNNPASTDKKISVLSQADCLTCAGKRQRSYFNGWLVQAGRVPEHEHFIRYIPISLSPQLPERIDDKTTRRERPLFVSGGGWFPWQNQSKAIFAICDEIIQRNNGRIRIFGTPHETNTLSAEERVIRDIYARVCQLAETSPRIQVGGYIGRSALIDIYRSASVAVEAMQYNLERELAFTTRTIEYLWCGLPVIYNNYSEISDHIADYDAGWTIDPNNEPRIREVVAEIFSDPALVDRKSANAQRLVRDRFAWDKTILPLVDFLKNPVTAPSVVPALGAVWSCPSFLSPRGATVEVPLPIGESLKQDFIIPAEDIGVIEIPYSFRDAGNVDNKNAIDSAVLSLKLLENGAGTMYQRNIQLKQLTESGKLSIRFPMFRRPPGGKKLQLELILRSDNHHATNYFTVRGMLQSPFPFLRAEGKSFRALSLGGDAVEAQALAMAFVPSSGKVYHLKLLAERAYGMIRRGEWTRLANAAFRRSPQAIRRLKDLVLSQT